MRRTVDTRGAKHRPETKLLDPEHFCLHASTWYLDFDDVTWIFFLFLRPPMMAAENLSEGGEDASLSPISISYVGGVVLLLLLTVVVYIDLYRGRATLIV
jgi:hypothetical protein